ncbi:MAG: hypothetical protein M3Z67_09200 [Commensalibacter sp.]|nr:hypothetical protein [Commensalibacter sp.]
MDCIHKIPEVFKAYPFYIRMDLMERRETIIKTYMHAHKLLLNPSSIKEADQYFIIAEEAQNDLCRWLENHPPLLYKRGA